MSARNPRTDLCAHIPFVVMFIFACAAGAPAYATVPVLGVASTPDWVCVTTSDLAPSYTPLAAHRETQGLSAVVLALDEVLLWSPVAPDTMASLRWLATVARDQWGASYLLLGGSHDLLPAPLHRLESTGFTWDKPTDAYFACLDGDWDVDGDGLVAEYGEDAADPTVHLAVGRVPLDDPVAVGNAVAKIIAFEQRDPHLAPRALFVASLMDPDWDGTRPYPNHILARVHTLQDSLALLAPDLVQSALFQGPGPATPLDDPLNPAALVDSLRLHRHDFVQFQLNGAGQAWELVGHQVVNGGTFAPLSGAGHGFIGVMTSGDVANSTGRCILADLLALPDGGLVAAAAPSGLGYLVPLWGYRDLLWEGLLDGSEVRLGDAHRQALAAYFDVVPDSSPVRTTYWYLGLLGDPATRIRPLPQESTVLPALPEVLALTAVPNPFNASTELRFRVPGDAARHVRLEVFDVRGRRVASLWDGVMAPGDRVVPWRSTDASGLYIARLEVAGLQAMRKILMVE